MLPKYTEIKQTHINYVVMKETGLNKEKIYYLYSSLNTISEVKYWLWEDYLISLDTKLVMHTEFC